MVVSLFLLIPLAKAQWPPDPNVNLTVCDTSGNQELPKIAVTSDGGCYISWFDTRAGAYRVYMQRLDAQGVKQWGTTGLLVSNNTQSTSLVDWDLAVDDSNNAIVVFTDIRAGGVINPFAYKISPQGEFRWGANGVSLSNATTVFQADPKVVKTSDGSFVFVWQYGSSPNQVAMQKLNAAGVKQWGSDPILISGGAEHRWRPSLVASDSGCVILLYAAFTGTTISPQNYKLLSQKVSPTGTTVWADTVYSLGRVSGFFVPKIFSDGNYGAFYVWHDERGGANSTSYVQHFTSTGTELFPTNGSASSTLSGRLHNDAWVAYTPSNGETYMFWYETNSSTQNVHGVYGQKFSAAGSGIAFRPFGGGQPSFIRCFAKDSSAVVFYLQLSTATTHLVKGFRTDRNGTLLWGGSIKDVSSLVSGKGRLTGVLTSTGNSIFTWADSRQDANGVYAQNVNFDGTLGTSAPPPAPGWTLYASPFASSLGRVKAVSQNIAWAAGAGGTVLRSMDHGITWDSVGGGRIGTADVYAIDALDANTALVTTTPSTTTYILRTTNGGALWDTVYAQPAGFIIAIRMVSSTMGFAVGDPVGGTWTIAKTTNSGATWARIATEPTPTGGEGPTGLSTVGTTHLWIPSSNGGVYRSTSSGATWNRSTLPIATFIGGIWFNSTTNGVVGGNNGLAARTTDGGVSWTLTTIPGAGGIQSVGGAGPEFFVAKGTTIYRSIDQGVTWSASFSYSTAQLTFVGYGPYISGWVVGGGSNIAGYYGLMTDVRSDELLPPQYRLLQNYPNPFNPTTRIQFHLPARQAGVPYSGHVELKLYDVLGREVATLLNEELIPGRYSKEWDATGFSSGVYFYRLKAGMFVETRKLLLLR
ncbi:MAG: FlgD ig protein [Bacteroidetes bacterium]|nr:FlgD ig protein [Bacteroidota bacterium]